MAYPLSVAVGSSDIYFVLFLQADDGDAFAQCKVDELQQSWLFTQALSLKARVQFSPLGIYVFVFVRSLCWVCLGESKWIQLWFWVVSIAVSRFFENMQLCFQMVPMIPSIVFWPVPRMFNVVLLGPSQKE